MYCGSCLRDNALATALKRLGHHVVLVPLYTPLKTDSPDASIDQVFMGGVNTYLQHASGLFRKTPRALDWLFDRPWLLGLAGKWGANTSPAKLGPFTLSILRGDEGPVLKELRRLVRFLKDDLKPDVVSLPNAMFIGLARMMRQELNVPVVVELTGEDIFLDALVQPYRSQATQIIRAKAHDVTRFVATSDYYADRMTDFLQVPREQIVTIPPGIDPAHLDKPQPAHDRKNPTIGYFARIAPEKGLQHLVDAFISLKKMPGLESAQLRAAGYLGDPHREWFNSLQNRLASAGLSSDFHYAGEVDLQGKINFLDSIDVLSVPTEYAEPKGMYILEAWARAVPCVQPRHGSFPELINSTGAGVLVPPGNTQALADALAFLLKDPQKRRELGQLGQQAVRDRYTDTRMAEKMVELYEDLIPATTPSRSAVQ